MKIETKFDVGQEVWPIYFFSENTKCSECGRGQEAYAWRPIRKDKIKGIETYAEVDQVASISYRLHLSLTVEESDLFPTKAEAQAECDRRNGKGEG